MRESARNRECGSGMCLDAILPYMVVQWILKKLDAHYQAFSK